jgi:hypothetical protein
MCINKAPILTKPQDADQPTTRCRTVKRRESCLGPIDHHSPPPPPPRSSSDSAPRMPHRTLTTQDGIRETTKRLCGHADIVTGRNQEKAYGRESADGRLHSRWSSSAWVVVDRPPSQPLSFRRMSGGSRTHLAN